MSQQNHPNLQKMNFYKISSPCGGKCYIGSTLNSIEYRLSNHKCRYMMNPKYSSCGLLFDEFGVNNCKIELIATHWCESNEEKLKMERLYYELNKDRAVNKNRPYRTEEEKTLQNREGAKRWYQKNNRYKTLSVLANYYKKKDEKTTCPRCGKADVCALTLKSHMKSAKCLNHLRQHLELNQNEL